VGLSSINRKLLTVEYDVLSKSAWFEDWHSKNKKKGMVLRAKTQNLPVTEKWARRSFCRLFVGDHFCLFLLNSNSPLLRG